MQKENISRLELELQAVSYQACADDCPESEEKRAYTCQMLPLDNGKQRTLRYQLNILKKRNGNTGYDAQVKLLATVIWKRLPTAVEKDAEEKKLRYFCSIKAANILYALTNETFGVPDIFPPYFDEDVEALRKSQA